MDEELSKVVTEAFTKVKFRNTLAMIVECPHCFALMSTPERPKAGDVADCHRCGERSEFDGDLILRIVN